MPLIVISGFEFISNVNFFANTISKKNITLRGMFNIVNEKKIEKRGVPQKQNKIIVKCAET